MAFDLDLVKLEEEACSVSHLYWPLLPVGQQNMKKYANG